MPYRPADTAPEIPDVIGAIRDEGWRVAIWWFRSSPAAASSEKRACCLTRVLYRKQTARKQFVVVDAAMNDLIRPALYKSHHEIVPVRKIRTREVVTVDVVGPVCETGDFLAKDRDMPSG